MSATKQLPNIIICGTPGIPSWIVDLWSNLFSLGVGKTRLCQEICSANKSLTYLNINELAKQQKFLLEYDEENECQILDDDAIHDYFEDEYFQKTPPPSGLIIDYHSAGIIPDSDLIHGIFVIRCSNDKLYDRFKQRNYSEKKIDQNIQSEIFQICLDEARETFDENLVHEITNETEEEFKKNVENLLNWIDQWSTDNNKTKKKKKK
jgi:adenylate kinase